MRSLAARLPTDLLNLCIACADVVREVLSHAGHGHTPWL